MALSAFKQPVGDVQQKRMGYIKNDFDNKIVGRRKVM